MLRWDNIAPFGRPVVPDVYKIIAVSSSEISTGSSNDVIDSSSCVKNIILFSRSKGGLSFWGWAGTVSQIIYVSISGNSSCKSVSINGNSVSLAIMYFTSPRNMNYILRVYILKKKIRHWSYHTVHCHRVHKAKSFANLNPELSLSLIYSSLKI